MEFDDLLKGRFLLDGGFGSLLMARLPKSARLATPAMANLTHPETVAGIYSDYGEAGSMAVTANTFGANPIALKKHGADEKEALRLTSLGIKIAKDMGLLTMLDIGPTGGLLRPIGALSPLEVYEAYLAQAKAGAEAGADAFIIETMGDIAEARLAALAAADAANLPVLISFSFENERLLTGGTPQAAAAILTLCGAAAVGVNCSTGPEQMAGVISGMLGATHLPVFAQPNAGMPVFAGGEPVYPLNPRDMAEKSRALLDAGAAGIGGCCGTTPEHIRALSGVIAGYSPLPARAELPRCAISPRRANPQSLAQTLSRPVRIAPNLDAAYDIDPEATLAVIALDALGTHEIADFVCEAQQILKTPVMFGCGDGEKLKTALLCYAGAAFVSEKAFDGAMGAIYTQNPM